MFLFLKSTSGKDLSKPLTPRGRFNFYVYKWRNFYKEVTKIKQKSYLHEIRSQEICKTSVCTKGSTEVVKDSKELKPNSHEHSVPSYCDPLKLLIAENLKE